MSKKALKVVVEVTFISVSCPGVHLSDKDDIFLNICFMGQCSQSENLPAVFPLLFHEKMTFEKIFRHAVDPGDITVLLEYETVRIELVQLIPPMGDTLACFEEDARHFLFPEPKLVPSFSGVDREVLMTRAYNFTGIAPRLEFSTKTTIAECSADDEINVYPNVAMRPVIKRNRKCTGRRATSSPQRKRTQSLNGKQHVRMKSESKNNIRSLSQTPRSQSMSPLRSGNTRHLARLSLDSANPGLAHCDLSSTSKPMLSSWPGASPSALPHHSTSSPSTKSLSSVSFSPCERRKSLLSGLNTGISEDESSSSETNDPLDYHNRPDPPALWLSYRKQSTHSRTLSSCHKEWEEVHERVRGLLTTPKAVRRLVHGATVSEIDRILEKSCISPGPL